MVIWNGAIFLSVSDDLQVENLLNIKKGPSAVAWKKIRKKIEIPWKYQEARDY